MTTMTPTMTTTMTTMATTKTRTTTTTLMSMMTMTTTKTNGDYDNYNNDYEDYDDYDDYDNDYDDNYDVLNLTQLLMQNLHSSLLSSSLSLSYSSFLSCSGFALKYLCSFSLPPSPTVQFCSSTCRSPFLPNIHQECFKTPTTISMLLIWTNSLKLSLSHLFGFWYSGKFLKRDIGYWLADISGRSKIHCLWKLAMTSNIRGKWIGF